mmetsp:Transcript_9157/g.26991  ORF Transcript_9157/g.26991 Transcript_9157/m.26991 type:complete len:182 (+) Transcript_9157:2-547(+)
MITTYVISVERDGSTWKVEHRYSDWSQLDKRLERLAQGRPTLPPRSPLHTERVAAYRQKALDAYLQQVLELSLGSPLVRSELLDFLSHSHLYWQYAGALYAWRQKATGTGGRRASIKGGSVSTLAAVPSGKGGRGDPLFQHMRDLVGVHDSLGDELGKCRRWLPEKRPQDNWNYWMKVMGT